jgi:hypothetical protein
MTYPRNPTNSCAMRKHNIAWSPFAFTDPSEGSGVNAVTVGEIDSAILQIVRSNERCSNFRKLIGQGSVLTMVAILYEKDSLALKVGDRGTTFVIRQIQAPSSWPQ